MKKKMIMSIVCAMALLFTAGCSGNKASESAQQNSAPAAAAESTAEPDIHDIGILASTDPVALDQACVDLIYQAEGNESLVDRMESLHGIHTLEHAEEIGLGSRTYELVKIDG